MLRALARGLTLSDFDLLTVGGILDFIIASNNAEIEDPEEDIRYATQADFDRF